MAASCRSISSLALGSACASPSPGVASIARAASTVILMAAEERIDCMKSSTRTGCEVPWPVDGISPQPLPSATRTAYLLYGPRPPLVPLSRQGALETEAGHPVAVHDKSRRLAARRRIEEKRN